jgi:hypothetical protein
MDSVANLPKTSAPPEGWFVEYAKENGFDAHNMRTYSFEYWEAKVRAANGDLLDYACFSECL